MPCGVCTTRKDLRQMCCLPLAPFCILCASCLILYQTYQLVNAVETSDLSSSAAYISIILSCLQILIGLIGLVAVVFRWAKGVAFLAMGFKFVLFAFIFSLVGLWLVWILNACGVNETNTKWKPNNAEYAMMTITTVVSIVVFILAWWIFSAINSLKMVVLSGGNGWEYKNFKEIKAGGKARFDAETDTV